MIESYISSKGEAHRNDAKSLFHYRGVAQGLTGDPGVAFNRALHHEEQTQP